MNWSGKRWTSSTGKSSTRDKPAVSRAGLGPYEAMEFVRAIPASATKAYDH